MANPLFYIGDAHTAHVALSNPTSRDIKYSATLAVGNVSEIRSIDIGAGEEGTVDFFIADVLPATEGEYDVFLSVKVGDRTVYPKKSIGKITMAAVPRVEVLGITWD